MKKYLLFPAESSVSAGERIDQMAAAGWQVHTFTLSDNGYMGGVRFFILFEKEV